MKKRGKIIYITYDTVRNLEAIGLRYICRSFLENNHRISYNKSIRFLIDLLKVAEKIELTPRLDKDENENEDI